MQETTELVLFEHCVPLGETRSRHRRIRASQSSSCDGCSEPHDQHTGDGNTEVGPHEDLPARGLSRHVDVVVGRQGDPTDTESPNDTAKGENAGCFGTANGHWKVDEVFCRHTDDHKKCDSGRDPSILFIPVNVLVSEHAQGEGTQRDNDSSRCGGKCPVSNGTESLRAGDSVRGRPADTSDAVEASNEFSSPESPREARGGHLTKTKSWAKSRAESRKHRRKYDEEEDREPTVSIVELFTDIESPSCMPKVNGPRIPTPKVGRTQLALSHKVRFPHSRLSGLSSSGTRSMPRFHQLGRVRSSHSLDADRTLHT